MKSLIRSLLHSRSGKVFTVGAIVVMGVLCFSLWKASVSHPRWTSARQGDAGVLSMASGYDSAGNEILVAGGYIREDGGEFDSLVSCYEVKDGRIRWEIREQGSIPETNAIANVAIDSSGDVLVGWKAGTRDSNGNGMLTKYSGKNGSPMWKWKPKSEQEQFLAPVADKSGNVWVTWLEIKSKQYGWGCLNVTVLNGKTGQAKWTAR